MRVEQALGGRKVYGQGSYAPTRGQVDPRGYIKREIKKKGLNRGKHLGWYKTPSRFGPDGQSDTRSGLAQNALQSASGQASGGAGAWPQVAQPNSGSATGTQPHNPLEPHSGQASGSGGRTPYQNEGRPIAGSAPAIPTVQINANGQLDLPYNQEFSEGVLQMKDEVNSQLMELQRASQNEALQYAMAQRAAEQQFGGLQRQTLNDNAARGTAFSSGYGLAVGNNAADFNNAQNDMLAQHNLFGQQVSEQRTAMAAAFQDYIRRAVQSMGHELGSTQAGTLGFGKSGTRKKRRTRR